MSGRALALVITVLAFCGSARAQDDTLPITLIAESTFSERDAAAILHVLKSRASRRGVSIETMARRYSAVWKRDELPQRIFDAIERFPAKYSRIVKIVDSFERGELRNPCPGADHWGAPYGLDLERARKAGWKRLSCGTANVFWSLR